MTVPTAPHFTSDVGGCAAFSPSATRTPEAIAAWPLILFLKRKASRRRTDANPCPRSGTHKTTHRTGHNAASQEPCKAHPTEKRPGRVPGTAHLLLSPWACFSAGPVSRRPLALLRGDRKEGCPPLLHVLASAVWAGGLALLMLRKGQDFREFLLAGSTEKIVLGHSSLPR